MKHFGMCMNWKVVAGLAVIGLGVWAIAPNLIGAVAPLLLLAACPLSMIFMMRGMGTMGGNQSAAQPAQASQPTLVGGTREEQLAALKARHEAIARDRTDGNRTDAATRAGTGRRDAERYFTELSAVTERGTAV